MRHSVSVMPGTIMSSFELSTGAVSNARLGRGSILRFRPGKHIVEIAERNTELAHGRCDAALRNLRRLRRTRLTQTIPRRTATAAASARALTPSLAKRLATWV